jgi:hypothetical protein
MFPFARTIIFVTTASPAQSAFSRIALNPQPLPPGPPDPDSLLVILGP